MITLLKCKERHAYCNACTDCYASYTLKLARDYGTYVLYLCADCLKKIKELAEAEV